MICFLIICAGTKRNYWSERRDSNPRPSPWQGDALSAELLSQQVCSQYLFEPAFIVNPPSLRGLKLYNSNENKAVNRKRRKICIKFKPLQAIATRLKEVPHILPTRYKAQKQADINSRKSDLVKRNAP